MNIKVKSMILEHFKGFENVTYDFGMRTFVKAGNGLGKSTIVAGHNWLWFDKDENLSSSPKVVTTIHDIPNYDNLVKATEILDIDGREVTVTKIQKNTLSKKTDANGVHKLTTSNSYEVNCIPKNEKEFKAYFMEEFNLDIEKLLVLSHIDVFLNQKQADMRKVLFSMAKGKNDVEICQSQKNLAQLAGLLEKGYKTEEVTAMQTAKLKQAEKEMNGIEPKISENRRQIIDVDVAGLQASKECITKLIADGEKQLTDVDSQTAQISGIQAEMMKVQFDIGECIRRANLSLTERRRELSKQIDEKALEIYKIDSDIATKNRERSSKVNSMNDFAREYKESLAKYNEWKEQKFDESTLVCPTCGQNLPAEKAVELKDSFESKKRSNMESFKKKGSEKATEYNKLKSEIVEIDSSITSLKANKETLDSEKQELESELSSLPQSVDMTDNQEHIFLQSRLHDIQLKLDGMQNYDERKATIRQEIQKNRETLSVIERQLSQVDSNQKIQERIKELEDSKVELSQQKSDCEMILEQIKQLSKEKNSLLADEINSMFSKISWKLFDYQKDGSYKEVCIPMLDGFTYDKMNGARRVTTKIDIIAGLQKFYGISTTLFADEMESVNDVNIQKCEFQLVVMKVIEPVYELNKNGKRVLDTLGKPIILDDAHLRVEVEE